MTKRILIVITSHDRLGETGRTTGYWLEELAVPYYAFLEAGAEIALASPAGGRPPMDPASAAEEAQNETTRRFLDDAAAQAAMGETTPLSEIDPGAFDAVFYPGGHGPLWDLVDDRHSIALIEALWAAGKPVAAVCHAPIVLANAKDPSGRPIVEGRRVTGFSNDEEAAVGLTDAVPHLVEDVLRGRGGTYVKAGTFETRVETDGTLVTGQNPPSSAATAAALLAALELGASA